jgi:hypothetical protein
MLTVAVLAAAALTGCGGEEEPSAQEAYCEAASSLGSSIDSLTDLDLVAEGTDGLEADLAAVREDLAALRSSAGEAARSEVDALGEAVQALEDAVADVGGEPSSEGLASVSDAVADVAASARAVQDTLSECP